MHPNFVLQMPETEIFWTANWPPLQDFAGAMGLVFVSTGHKTRLGHFALCFGVFRSVRRIEVFLELTGFHFHCIRQKENAVSVQTGLSFF